MIEAQNIKIKVSEMFYSIQGEGFTAGVPAVFLRLPGCNLNCGGKYAAWQCDSVKSWKKSIDYTLGSLIEEWEKRGWAQRLMNGAHLVITGGEPLLHMETLTLFFNFLESCGYDKIYIEVETNGTLVPNADFDAFVALYNCSPKLKSSGVHETNRVVAAAIRYFAANEKTAFKFVVCGVSDLAELKETFLKPYEITSHNVWLMPAGATLVEQQAAQPYVADACKDNDYNFSPRLQVLIWNKTLGV